mmetsp:Transcript_13866/g.35403  ORF Transcript_13866/g.35403 Transcript_13866/m.35403 type:complete len:261 (-) Transcript_13866:411-1193(-)|eukprot:CAMPEP_0174240864 /NCGR_PEP_ID=MMETSP0417-20130205/20924_1 /TAXON_ID=242541 /ORGANISM="Mayorella sp, Strain BSH-02190019" /LENGTH=260 /DNA_ID=CAMNT_0015320027 /DNA_START=47 /DNA_END=829 /DNA_ORIENTATION=+
MSATIIASADKEAKAKEEKATKATVAETSACAEHAVEPEEEIAEQHSAPLSEVTMAQLRSQVLRSLPQANRGCCFTVRALLDHRVHDLYPWFGILISSNTPRSVLKLIKSALQQFSLDEYHRLEVAGMIRSSGPKGLKLARDYAVAISSMACKRDVSGVYRMTVPALSPLDKGSFECRSRQLAFNFFPVLASHLVVLGFRPQLADDQLMVSGDVNALKALRELRASAEEVSVSAEQSGALSDSISANLKKARKHATKCAQ